MKVTIEKSFNVDKSPDVVWGFLINPNKIVECVPGVTLKEKVNETTYKGSVSQKFGPVIAPELVLPALPSLCSSAQFVLQDKMTLRL